jgi:hypothetical protein
MGASLNAVTFRCNDRTKIAKEFEAMAEQARHESGHSYSGTIGELHGSIRWNDLKLGNERAANDWLADHHQKWDGPMAVSFKGGAVPEDRKKKAQELSNYVFGTLSRQVNDTIRQEVQALKAKGGFVKCSGCQSRLNAEKLTVHTCPLCQTNLLGKRSWGKVQKLKDEMKEKEAKVQELFKPDDTGEIWWLVGGWCSE